ncbi:glycosyl transferase [Virgibacillus phasianinus]|uniref:Glycosyl transferase n=1 Tax=Virgibacillus phasianinus TaxID=2017483 RepID=A0A220U736_9BACI|nr:glycosyltransferase [Virgibacillus phasianinus]ASK63716.1 glycosyl transferase [Virgibacillus phasianinus]
MKSKLLFVIDSLCIGGAEKSLVSLLNMIDPSLYDIDLLLFKKGGELEDLIPNYVNILLVPEYFRFINKEISGAAITNAYFYYYKFKTSFALRLNNLKKNPLHSEQVVYKCIHKIFTPLFQEYDVAIAYSQGMPTYFVANMVTSEKKLAWINTDYSNTLYDKEIDYDSYKKIDKIIAVSQHTKESVSKTRNEYHNKVEIFLDIINPKVIYKMAEEQESSEFDKSEINLLTVGRLEAVKAHNKAIEVAKKLKDSGYEFKWYVIGEGSEKAKLQKLIHKYGLNDYFILLGKKLNPYCYMKVCDIYVQTSLKEGFGLTINEAKILKRPIICTNFSAAKEIITNNVDGVIVEHDIDSIYYGIKKYLDDRAFKKKIENELDRTITYSPVHQISDFYKLISN